MAERWRPTVGAKVQRRWRPELGVGVVEELVRGSARVRWVEAEVSAEMGADLIGWHSPSHLTKPGRRLDCGPGKDRFDLCVFDQRVAVELDDGRRAALGVGFIVPSEELRR